MEIGSIANIASVLIACAAFWLSWRTHRRQDRADLPVVTADLKQPGAGGWRELAFVAKNRSPASWQIVEAAIQRPFDAKISQATHRTNGERPWEVLAMLPPSSKARSRTTVAGANMGPAGESSDTHHGSLFVWLPSSSRSRAVSIRLILSSNDAARRSMTIDIKRTASADISTAKD